MTKFPKHLVIWPGPRWLKRSVVQITLLPLWLPAIQIMAAAAKKETKLVNVADTRGLGPGLTKWVGDVYNTSYWEFGLLVVVIMAAMGLVLGYVCDRLVRKLGINLGKMQHHE
jgi:hypothetical protein